MQSPVWVHIVVPLAAVGLNAALQILLLRRFPRIGLLKSIFYAFGIGFGVLIFFEFSFAAGFRVPVGVSIPLAIANAIIYAALGYCYFHFINLGETARRIRILRELYESNAGLSMDEILKKYNADEVLQRRMGRLLRSHQVEEKNGKYYIARPTLLIMARIIVAMKVLFLGKESEFADKCD